MNNPNGPLLNERAAAGYLGVSAATLRSWRCMGEGPIYVRLGRSVRYLQSDLDAFLICNRVEPRAAA